MGSQRPMNRRVLIVEDRARHCSVDQTASLGRGRRAHGGWRRACRVAANHCFAVGPGCLGFAASRRRWSGDLPPSAWPTALHAGADICLTAKEFDLLAHFARHPGIVYTRAQLLDQVWGYGHDGYGHTVNSHINRLRAKIEPRPSQPIYIATVWGVGYRFHH